MVRWSLIVHWRQWWNSFWDEVVWLFGEMRKNGEEGFKK